MLNLEKGQVKYYVRAFSKNKDKYSFGDTVSYTTYCHKDDDAEAWYKSPPQLISPSNGVTGLPLSIKLVWDFSPMAKGSCDVYLDTLPDAAKKIAFFYANLPMESSYEIDSLKPSTTYYWKVVKLCSPCKDISSAINKFTTTQ
jgi:hypothetical protein